jgi:hypothetical protein
MFTHRWVLGTAVIGLLSCLYVSPIEHPSPPTKTAPAAALRVGVIDREKLLVAYYHSEVHEKLLASLQADLKRAKDKGDTDAVKQIEARGEALQDLAHRQLAGEATLANVMEPLRAFFPEVAKSAGVALIIEAPLYRDGTVEIVDVTPKLVEKLPAFGR